MNMDVKYHLRTLGRNPVMIVLLVGLLIRIIAFQHHSAWWDSAVYIGMGKYLFSAGASGFFEASRPVVWPLVLGIGWFFKVDSIIWGRIIQTAVSLGIIYLTYLIGREAFNKSTALIASLFVALSPLLIFHNTILLTGLPSTLLGMVSVYSFIRKRYLVAGLFAGLGFMTRFLQLGIFIVLVLMIIFYMRKKHLKASFASSIQIGIGFLIPVVPYLIFNIFRYRNPLYPFFLQKFMTMYTGWMYYEGAGYYLVNLLKENFLILFGLFGIVYIIGIIFSSISKPKPLSKIHASVTVLSVFIIFFMFFNSLAHKETRFMVAFFPYLYIITGYGMFVIFDYLYKKMNKAVVSMLLIVLLIVWAVQAFPGFFVKKQIGGRDIFQEYLTESGIENGIWVSSPIQLVYSDKKADALIYYPTLDLEKMNKLRGNVKNANIILLDTCDVPCPPTVDNCEAEKQSLIEHFKKEMEIRLYMPGQCEKLILERRNTE